MKKQRPKNLNLLTIRQPIPAIVSILHRITGVILFLSIPLLLWTLEYSLASETNFQNAAEQFSTPLVKVLLWLFLVPYIYHFVAGIRHLLMDINIGVELKSGRLTAMLTLVMTILLIVIAGIYLW